jgi:hypothetical protein
MRDRLNPQRAEHESAEDESADRGPAQPSNAPIAGNTSSESVDAGAAIRALIRELQIQRQHGITTPSHLFSVLHRHLQVERGALLVPDAEHEFVPMAIAGLDETSRLRLRIPRDELMTLIDPLRASLIDGEPRNAFEARLSRGDFRTAPRIGVFPFNHARKLLAVLFVFDSPLLDLDPAVLDVVLGALSDNAGRLLFDGRQRPLGWRSRAVVLTAEQLPALLDHVSGRENVMVNVDLRMLLDEILEAHPYLDVTRLVNDVMDTIGMLLTNSYSVIRLDTAHIGIVGEENPDISPELLVHVLTTTLRELFGCGSGPTLTFRPLDPSEVRRTL